MAMVGVTGDGGGGEGGDGEGEGGEGIGREGEGGEVGVGGGCEGIMIVAAATRRWRVALSRRWQARWQGRLRRLRGLLRWLVCERLGASSRQLVGGLA